ncbi:MAG TPA: hypothetical protein VJ779_11285 [Acetobacteraceae bacterium]|nr:hypothetical protein [Acetobacteraceae bacterium]
MSDDAEARRRRVARLREQIDSLTKQPGVPGSEQGAPETQQRRNAPRVRPVSPRTFVEQRMRELDSGKKRD